VGERVFVRARVSDGRPKVLFSLRGGSENCESIRTDLAFDEYVDFSARPKGRTVHLSGYIRDESASAQDVHEAQEAHSGMEDEDGDDDDDFIAMDDEHLEADPNAASDDEDEDNLDGEDVDTEPLRGIVKEGMGADDSHEDPDDRDTVGSVRLVAEQSSTPQKRRSTVTITELQANEEADPADTQEDPNVGKEIPVHGKRGDENSEKLQKQHEQQQRSSKKRRKKRNQHQQQQDEQERE
jgi:hypothetical protein